MPMSIVADLRALPRVAWILFAGTFINRFGSFVHPFLVLYMTSRGHSVVLAGLAMGAYGSGHFAAAIVGGYLADRIGRRRSIALSMFASSATMLALAAVDSVGAIMAFAALAGLASELYRPAAAALLADLTDKGNRLMAYGAYRLAVNAGFAIGPATAGFLATKSFAWLFIGDAITSLAFGVIALTLLPDGTRSESGATGWLPVVRFAVKDPPFLRLLVASVIASCLFFQFSSTLPLHVVDAGFTPQLYGLLISVNAVMIIVLELPIVGFARRFDPTRVMAVGFVVTGLAFGSTGLATTLLLLSLHTMAWTVGEMTFAPVSASYVADLTPERFRGRYMGIWQFTWSIGLTLGPAGCAWLYASDPRALWTACLVAGFSAAVVITREGHEDGLTEPSPEES